MGATVGAVTWGQLVVSQALLLCCATVTVLSQALLLSYELHDFYSSGRCHHFLLG